MLGKDDLLGPEDRFTTPAQAQPSVQPEWCRALTVQQQSVLLLAARGPDGVEKLSPCKAVQRAYRGTVLVAAVYGRPLKWGERGDSFMSLDDLDDDARWGTAVDAFFGTLDSLPAHYVKHMMHGAEILGYKHPDPKFRERWRAFYERIVVDMHLAPESEADMDRRLGDWGRQSWERDGGSPFVVEAEMTKFTCEVAIWREYAEALEATLLVERVAGKTGASPEVDARLAAARYAADPLRRQLPHDAAKMRMG